MAYARNRFQSVGPGSHILGTVIEYDPSRRRNDSQGNWKWVVLAVLLLASFVCTYFFSRNREPPLVVSSPETVVPAAVTNAPLSPAPEAILPPAAK